MKKKKLGLALGSGGFRGSAHVGVLKALEENGIKIDFMSGSSAGALIGAHYSLFHDVERIEKDLLEQQKNKYHYLRDIALNGGFLSGKKFQKNFEKMYSSSSFSDFKNPMKIVSTDLKSGKSFIFDKGDIATAVRASISIPLAFAPFQYEGMLLVDGGLSNPVPDDIVRGMGADVVLSVNLYNREDKINIKNDFSEVLARSIEITLFNLSDSSMASSDLIINPDSASHFKTNSLNNYFNRSMFLNIMNDAYNLTLTRVKEVKKLLT